MGGHSTVPIETRILIAGLYDAGKTTMLYKLDLGEIETTMPMICVHLETMKYKSVSFTSLDVDQKGGRFIIRRVLDPILTNNDGIIFVIDSSDRERIEESKIEFVKLLQQEQLQGAKLLVLANKQDMPGAMSLEEIADRFQLRTITDRQWQIRGTSGETGEGLIEAFNWLLKSLGAPIFEKPTCGC